VQRNLVDADVTADLCDVVSRYGLCRITSEIVEAVPDWHDTGALLSDDDMTVTQDPLELTIVPHLADRPEGWRKAAGPGSN